MDRPEQGHGKPALEDAGGILSLIATRRASSRAELLQASGLSRVTVTQRLNRAAHQRPGARNGGNAPKRWAADAGAGRQCRKRLRARRQYRRDAYPPRRHGPQARHYCANDAPFTVESGPDVILTQIEDAFADLAAEAAKTHNFFMGISLSLPTPVDFKRGCVVGPSVLHGWDDFDIIGRLKARFGVPVSVENDVNLMTISEHRRRSPLRDDMLFVKIGTGIGSGMIAAGHLFRGAQGAAGDIGHIQFLSDDAPLCRCGKFGCVEARAAGWAIARDLSTRGFKAETARDVIELVEQRKPEALMLVREAGRTIGEVISDVVSIINPSLIIIGGTLAQSGDLLLSGVRELVYQRCLPLATRDLHHRAFHRTGRQRAVRRCLSAAGGRIFPGKYRPSDRTFFNADRGLTPPFAAALKE